MIKPSDLRARLRSRYRRSLTDAFGRRRIRLPRKVPLISFTFDDFPESALRTGGAILEEYGLVATYYAALGLMNEESPVGRIFSADDLQELLAEGHELGCHTFAHCHAWDTEPQVFEESIIDNRRALDQVLPGAVFTTLSYPISNPRPETKRRAAKHFACCRGGNQTFNVGTLDLNCLRAFFLEQSRGNAALVKEIIDHSCKASGWLIFATHDIREHPSRFGCTPKFFEEVVSHAAQTDARILPVGKALDAIYGNDASDIHQE